MLGSLFGRRVNSCQNQVAEVSFVFVPSPQKVPIDSRSEPGSSWGHWAEQPPGCLGQVTGSQTPGDLQVAGIIQT